MIDSPSKLKTLDDALPRRQPKVETVAPRLHHEPRSVLRSDIEHS